MMEEPKASLLAFLEKSCSEKTFPGCVLAWGAPSYGAPSILAAGLRGLTRNREPVEVDLAYDLASLTKIVSTATLLMIAIENRLLSLSTSLGDLGWAAPEELKILTVLDLLSHRSGLPSWRPYWTDASLSEKGRLKEAILRERPLFAPRGNRLYSDLNFMLLGFIIEEVFKEPLDSLFTEKIAKKLCLSATGFNPKGLKIAPTEDGPRVGGPLDFPGLKPLGPVPLARVHDDNAALLGGAAGHAGLFGTAGDLFALIADWARSYGRDEGILVGRGTLALFLAPAPSLAGPLRAAGFDVNLGSWGGARGHLGYVGGSLWWSPEADKAYVLLSNRVHPTARGSKMETFRQNLHKILATFKGRGI
jgi:CubicO group peptidase (beta-lactamase class C family)